MCPRVKIFRRMTRFVSLALTILCPRRRENDPSDPTGRDEGDVDSPWTGESDRGQRRHCSAVTPEGERRKKLKRGRRPTGEGRSSDLIYGRLGICLGLRCVC